MSDYARWANPTYGYYGYKPLVLVQQVGYSALVGHHFFH